MLGEYSASAGTEPYVTYGRVLVVGGDLVVVFWGGTAHVGAVAIAQARPSHHDPQVRSATGSVLTLLGHREDVLAKRIAERLAAALDRTVVVAAGLHWDDLATEDIPQVEAACEECADKLLAQLRS